MPSPKAPRGGGGGRGGGSRGGVARDAEPAPPPPAEISERCAAAAGGSDGGGGAATEATAADKTDSPPRSGDAGSGGGGLAAAAAKPLDDFGETFSALQFLRFIGGGLLMSVSYLDPGNLEADIQVGVQAGYSLLWWFALVVCVLGFSVQNLAGQVGIATDRDLAVHCGQRFPRFARILLWVLMEVAVVGADIQETVGGAIALAMLSNGRLPLWAGCIVISAAAFLFLLLTHVGFRQLEAVFAMLIGLEGVAMGINFFQASIPAVDLFKGFIPTLSRTSVVVAVGALGALVMPYNVFFQSSIVNSHARDKSTEGRILNLLRFMRLENFLMLFITFVINVFVVCVFAEGFYDPDADPPREIGLQSAGDYLAELYGSAFRTMWAIGLLASSLVATISLTYAGQLIMAGLLNIRVEAGVRMVATRLVALLPTVLLAVLFEASNTFDKVAQVLNLTQSLLLPFALLPAVHCAANVAVMGKRWVSSRWWTIANATISAAVIIVNVYVLFDLFGLSYNNPEMWGVSAVCVLVYIVVVAYFAVGPEHVPALWGRARAAALGSGRWVRRLDPESMIEVHW